MYFVLKNVFLLLCWRGANKTKIFSNDNLRGVTIEIMKNLHFTMQNWLIPPTIFSSQINACGCYAVRVQKLRHFIYRVHLRVPTRQYMREGSGYHTWSPNSPRDAASVIVNGYVHSCPGDKAAEAWSWLTQSHCHANNLWRYNSVTPYVFWASSRLTFIW